MKLDIGDSFTVELNDSKIVSHIKNDICFSQKQSPGERQLFECASLGKAIQITLDESHEDIWYPNFVLEFCMAVSEYLTKKTYHK